MGTKPSLIYYFGAKRSFLYDHWYSLFVSFDLSSESAAEF